MSDIYCTTLIPLTAKTLKLITVTYIVLPPPSSVTQDYYLIASSKLHLGPLANTAISISLFPVWLRKLALCIGRSVEVSVKLKLNMNYTWTGTQLLSNSQINNHSQPKGVNSNMPASDSSIHSILSSRGIRHEITRCLGNPWFYLHLRGHVGSCWGRFSSNLHRWRSCHQGLHGSGCRYLFLSLTLSPGTCWASQRPSVFLAQLCKRHTYNINGNPDFIKNWN